MIERQIRRMIVKLLVLYIYEFLSAFLPVFICLMIWQKRKQIRLSKISCGMIFVFVIYITGVYHVTGAGTLYDGLRYQLEMRADQINLIPFSNDISVIGYLLNIVLGIPLGILIPLIWEKRNTFLCTLRTGFFFSLLIEISQLLNNRSSDIDDLLMNTAGTAIGFLCYKVWEHSSQLDGRRKDVPISVLFIGIGAAFAGRFLLFNEMGCARWLYGF